jgi:hypothetical protein
MALFESADTIRSFGGCWGRVCHCEHVTVYCTPKLKVPKREKFDRLDFPHFYTIKSLRVGDFGVKINKTFKNIKGFI